MFVFEKVHLDLLLSSVAPGRCGYIFFYPSPVLTFRYCHRLRLCVCVCQSVCQTLACPRDNSGPVKTRIATFGPKMQKILVKVPIVFVFFGFFGGGWVGGHWPWPSRSNWNKKPEFTPLWACLHYNSLLIQARITKFGPEVEIAWLRSLLFWVAIDLDLQSQIWFEKSNFLVFIYIGNI